MKKPEDLEEFLVWPPIGVGAASIVGLTIHDSVKTFNETLLLFEGAYLTAGYLFPALLGFGISWSINGKYWLGFLWLSLLTYFLTLFIRFADLSGNVGKLYTILIMCSLTFLAQAIFLYLKRFGFNHITPK